MNVSKKEALEYYLDIRSCIERCNDLFCSIGIDLIGIARIKDHSAPHYFTSTIDKLSEYCAKYLRNRYHYSPIVIQ